jgi:MoxR-like ATPase
MPRSKEETRSKEELFFDRLQGLREALKDSLVERDAEIDGVLLAALSRQHVLLLGPPGTAKSLLVRLFTKGIGVEDKDYFARLITPFTMPEDMFGPIDIPALEQGVYERKTKGYLPTARVALADEVFKGSDSINNSLLTAMQERVFDNGTKRDPMPLEVLVGCSNEYPQSEQLNAMYDRFLLRYWTSYIKSDDNFKGMLMSLACGEPDIEDSVCLSETEFAFLQNHTREVQIPEAILDALVSIRRRLSVEHGIVLSDRRWGACLKILKANATLNGGCAEVEPRHMMVLADSMWSRAEQRPAIYTVVAEHAAPHLVKAARILDGVTERFGNLILEDATDGDLRGLLKVVNTAGEDLRRMVDETGELEIQLALEKVKGMHGQLGRENSQRMRGTGIKVSTI